MSQPDDAADPSDFNSRKPFGSAARLYRELGWMGTLPLPKGKKNPPPKGYTGAGRQDPTEAKVEAWLSNAETAKGNIGLRLGEVDREFWPDYLPSVYNGQVVDGWELIGIDVDDYKNKEGGNERLAIEYLHGELPTTAMSSARWGNGGSSCISIYFVPKGYRFMGKAADSIEVVQKRHRYMVAWPSVNPDAPTAIVEINGATRAVPARYVWKYGKPADAANVGSGLIVDIDGIPAIKASEGDTGAIAVLPEGWFRYLSRQGERESDDAISSLSPGGLNDWLTEELRWEGEPCKRVSNAVTKAVAELEDSPDSHTWLNSFLWQLFNLAAEGHSGIESAFKTYINAWIEHAVEHRGAAPEDLNAEIERSILGALSKIEPKYVVKPEGAEYAENNDVVEHLPLRDDICVGNEIENVDRLGPIIGPMPVNTCPPADQYDRCDRGNAQHFADLYGGNMHYYAPKQAWVFWTGTRWVEADEALACMAFERVRYEQQSRCEELWSETALFDPGCAETKAELKAATTAAKRMDDWYLKSGDRARVRNAVDMVKGEYRRDKDALDDEGRITPKGVLKGILLTDKIFDQKLNLLACSNGVLDLDDVLSGVRPARKDDYLSQNTNVPYISWKYIINGDPQTGEYPSGSKIPEQHKVWDSYLKMVLPDQEVRDYVQMVLGYCLIGGNPAKKVVFVEGQSNTGKTTMLQAIKNALGDYCGTGEVSMFKGQRFKTTLATNIYRRALVISEPNNSKDAMEADVVKSLSGNDTQTIELKYSNQSMDVLPHFTPVIACNIPPKADNSDDAFWSRILSVPFHEQISDRAKNDGDAEATVNATMIVLSWLVEGWAKYQSDPTALNNPPEKVRATQVDFTKEMDTETVDAEAFIKSWVEHNCETAANAPEAYAEAQAIAVATAKEKGKKVGATHWPEEWTAHKDEVWVALQAAASKQGIRLTARGKGHGEMLLRHLGIEAGQNKAARWVDGKPRAVYIGVKLRHNAGRLGKW